MKEYLSMLGLFYAGVLWGRYILPSCPRRSGDTEGKSK